MATISDQSVSFTAPTNTTHSVDIPATVAVGDLLLLIFGTQVSSVRINSGLTGWTLLGAEFSFAPSIHLYWKVAESGDAGSTLSIVTNNTGESIAVVYRITGYTGVPELALSRAAGPPYLAPELIPTWGNADNLWMTGAMVREGLPLMAVTGYPTDLSLTTDYTRSSSTSTSVGIIVGYDGFVGSEYNPDGNWGSLDSDWYLVNASTLVELTGKLSKYFTIAVAPQNTPIKKLKLFAESAAAGETGVSGVVFAAPTGAEITGAEFGEFTGKAFESTLESGQAVLKVPVADFGGDALVIGDLPVALVRNSTHTTGIVSCTVIEE